MSRADKLKVGITIGDIAGIGPEIIIRTFEDDRLFKLFTPVLYGNTKVISFYRKLLKIDKLQYNSVKDIHHLSHNSLNIVSAWDEDVEIEPGRPNNTTGKYALRSLEAATDALIAGDIDVLVTSPINKNFIHSEEFPFSGHTPYLQKKLENEEVLMFMVSENIKVGLVTEHVPLKEVSAYITKDAILKKLNLMNQSLIVDYGIDKPKIAVLGLNPHAGDDGLLGQEDMEIIYPAVKEARENDLFAFGPYPADGFFARSSHKKFDAILAMYHDQGLIPFKALCVGNGVNYTAGMKYVRTSPDHGTAESLVGKNIADESSFRQAIFEALDIYWSRLEYEERNANPLPKYTQFKEDR